MSTPTNLDRTLFPGALDIFPEVRNGDGPENVIHGWHPNKVQNALAAIQRQCRYSVISHGAGGPLLYIMQQEIRLARDLDSRTYNFLFEVPAGDANRYFGGQPFNRAHGLLVSATAWKVASGSPVFFHCHSAARIDNGQENGRQAKVVCVRGGDEWHAGNHIEAELIICKP
jgi:hypothetical protein